MTVPKSSKENTAMPSSPAAMKKSGGASSRSGLASSASSRAAAPGQKKLPVITAEELDRRFDAGDELEGYWEPISEKVMNRLIERSRRVG
jgi:hypothetical protein